MSDAIVLTIESVRTRASTNEALITFAIPLEQAGHVSGFMNKIGCQVAAAFVDVNQHTRQADVPRETKTTDGSYGHQARELRLSGFFRVPEVWRAIGSDEEFLNWLRFQKCAYCGGQDYIGETGDLKCEAAHVRRVSAGSGTSIKPEYSAVALCRKHHAMQHDKGESSLGDKDWWAKKRVQAVSEWGWITLREQLGYGSWKDVPPDQLLVWAAERELDGYLPAVYLETE